MSQKDEYVSILDGAEDDAPIVIIPDDDEERDYSAVSSHAGARAEDNVKVDTPPEKLTFLGTLRNFWYYHKTAVIIGVFVIAAFAALFATLSSKKTSDLTVAVYTENSYTNEQMLALKLLLSNYIEDFNEDTRRNVEADFFGIDEDSAKAQVDLDRKNGVRCIYITTKDTYNRIIELYPDMFESYNGYDEWIALSGTDFSRELHNYTLDCSDLGISLAALSEINKESYDKSVALLDALKTAYPDMFE